MFPRASHVLQTVRVRARWALPTLVAVGLLTGWPLPGAGDSGTGTGTTSDVIRVEEDWELVLNEPDGKVGAPQFHTAISPFAEPGWLYAQVTWNYWELPRFEPGGLQLQAWSGDHSLYETSFGSAELSTSSETVTWTQVMSTTGTSLTFLVLNGNSETWGSFGGNTLRITGHISLFDLDSYDPDTSVDNSGVTYGANRVESLGITQVRRYGPSGLISVDNTRRRVELPN